MANKKSASKSKRAPSADAGTTKVTRIKASETNEKSTSSVEKTTKKAGATTTAHAPITMKAVKKPRKKAKGQSVSSRIGGYFGGAWYELKQVHWPDRRNSWALTIGLIIFTLIFIAIILLLDALFQYLFGLVLGK